MARRFELSPSLAAAMLEALEVDAPRTPSTLGTFYRAWVASVPFTNLAKALAAVDGRPSPEADGAALCERWLRSGDGGTCWSQVAAFAGVCEQHGWHASASLERAQWKGPLEVDFHGSVVVTDGRRRWLCDLIHPSGDPLPVRHGAAGRHGPYAAGLRRGDDGVYEHWFHHPARDPASYRVLSFDLGPDDVRALVRVAEHLSGVRVDRVSWRRCPGDAVVSVRSVGRLWADDPAPDDPADPTALELVRWGLDGAVETGVGSPLELFTAAGARAPDVTAAQASRVVGAAGEGACNVDGGEQRFG